MISVKSCISAAVLVITAVVKKWYWGLRAFFIFFTVAAVPLWLALLGYTVSNGT